MNNLVLAPNYPVTHITMLKHIAQGCVAWIESLVERNDPSIPRSLQIGIELYITELLIHCDVQTVEIPYTPLAIEKLLKKPLSEWGIDWDDTVQWFDKGATFLQAFSFDGYGELITDIIRMSGNNLQNTMEIIQKDFYHRLLELAGSNTERYQTLREFMTRHPTILGQEVLLEGNNAQLFNELYKSGFYIPLPERYKTEEGKIILCSYCHYPVHPKSSHHGNKSCVYNNAERHYKSIRPSPLSLGSRVGAFILDSIPHQAYHLPGIPELRFYEELTNHYAGREGIKVTLYPNLDQLDIGVIATGIRIGLDVKDYQNPEKLGQALLAEVEKTKGFTGGNWQDWSEVIFVVPDHWKKDRTYMDLLWENLGSLPTNVYVKWISDTKVHVLEVIP